MIIDPKGKECATAARGEASFVGRDRNQRIMMWSWRCRGTPRARQSGESSNWIDGPIACIVGGRGRAGWAMSGGVMVVRFVAPGSTSTEAQQTQAWRAQSGVGGAGVGVGVGLAEGHFPQQAVASETTVTAGSQQPDGTARAQPVSAITPITNQARHWARNECRRRC
jgi:hypothetical protein